MAGTAEAQSVAVQPPPLWYDGDTHAHIQLCGTAPDLTPDDIYQTQLSADLSVTAALIWAKYKLPPASFFSLYAPFVTGMENPASLGDPEHILQFGTEASGFAASVYGHVMGLGISDTAFDPFVPFPAPILQYFRQQPNAISGYAHMFWESGYGTPSFIGGQAIPYMAPMDVVLGTVDFLEAPHVAQAASLDWRNLIYKLWNAGVRVPLAAGTDNSCLNPNVGDVRTYAQVDSDPLQFDKWTAAIEAGHTTISEGMSVFLDSDVDGVRIGAELVLASPGTVTVHGRLHHALAQGVMNNGSVRVLLNGAVIGSHPFSVSGSGVESFSLPVVMNRSGWIALDSDDAHTGPTYIIVGNEPIASAADGTYWVDYSSDFASAIVIQGALTGNNLLAAFNHIAAAQDIYKALTAIDLPLPAGVQTYGASTSACDGPIAIGVTAPPGQPFSITVVHAPPQASGYLVLGVSPVANPGGLPISNIRLHVDLSAPVALIPVTANEGGYTSFPIPFGSGTHFVGQFLWINPPDCGNEGLASASNAIDITVP